MSSEIIRNQTPEERELERKKAELASLEADLVQRELGLATLRAELRAFEARYINTVGILYAELDEIEAQIAEVEARLAPKDSRAQGRAAQARAQAQQSAQAAGAVQKLGEQKKFSASENLKKLYREVAKRIHPDLATDEQDRARRQELMAEANRAYEEGDEAMLRAILDEWESSPESVEGEGAGADLVRRGLEALASQQVRIVRFPQDRSMGNFGIWDQGTDSWIAVVKQILGTDNLAEARGNVTLPAGKLMCLYVSDDASTDLAPLSTLKPDDLQELHLGAQVTDTELAHISGLTGLQALLLTGTQITNASGVNASGVRSCFLYQGLFANQLTVA